MIGQSIAHYRITSKLGEGGMGEVYRATDTKLNREVAIKVLPAAVSADPDRLARFEREARTLAALDHPNIAAVYGVESGALVMQLIDGPTLADRLLKGPLPPDEAANLACQIADALEAAHEKGIIHRDLKPANIKVTPEGQVKLLDFGLAKAMESNSPASNPADSPTITQQMSMAGVVMGTAGYMSPEQTRGARVDHRTDIWAFGVVLYEMLTGRMLFGGETATDRIAAVLKSEFSVDTAPARFRPLLSRCLERDPRKRLGWISEARRTLDLRTAPDTTTGTSPRWRRFALAAALLIAGAAAGAFLLNRFHRPGSDPQLRARRITRVTSDGRSFRPTVSPDGKFVAYLSRRGSGRTIDLWIQQMNGGSSIRLAQGLVPFSSLAFSADSTKVYFSNPTPSPGVYEVPTLGGDPQLSIPEASNVALSPDGQWMAYLTINYSLMLKPAAGGQARELLSPANGIVWCYDSKSILVGQPRRRGILRIPIDGSKPITYGDGLANLDKRGFSDLNLTRAITWLPSNQLIFNARFGDASNLFQMPLDELNTAEPQAVTFGPWANDEASIANNRLVFASSQNTNRLWTVPADANAGKILGELRPITPENSETQFPDVSPDGNTVVFVSRRSQGQGVFALDKRTGKERTIFIGENPAAYSTLSPDGTQIAIGQRGRDFPAFILPAAGGEARSVGDASGRIRGWSPDGRYLLIWRGNDPPDSIYVLDVHSGKSSPVISVPGRRLINPTFSPDGKWVAFRSLANGELFIAPFRGAVTVPPSDWIKLAEGIGLSFWSPDSKTLYYSLPISPGALAQRFHRQPLTPEGRPAGPATEFLRLDDYTLAGSLLNTIKASKDAIYLLLYDRRSDIWATDLQ